MIAALVLAVATLAAVPPKSATVTIAAAGDIACDTQHAPSGGPGDNKARCHAKDTAALIAAARPEGVLPLGDLQYFEEDRATFESGYGASWGAFAPMSYPVAGNHEYLLQDAAGYFDYWGTRAGPRGRGWYSYDLGAWHFIALNGNCGERAVGGCGAGSPQLRWLQADLRAHPRGCRLAYWHQPRFSSGPHGNNSSYDAFWQALYGARVDVVLNGHDHDYERFVPLDPRERAVPDGIREFVVGTGGRNHSPFFFPPQAASAVRNTDTFGVLLMTLSPRGYSWRFAAEPGATFTDSGEARCHRP